MTELTTLIDLLTKGGLVTALLVALWGGMRGWYVWKNTHEETVGALNTVIERTRQEKDKQIEDLHQDRDYWRDQAIRCMSNTGRLVNVFEAPKPQISESDVRDDMDRIEFENRMIALEERICAIECVVFGNSEEGILRVEDNT